MLHIISQFLKKQNLSHFIMRFGLLYAGALSVWAIVLIRAETRIDLLHDRQIECLLVSAITAVLQGLIGAWLLNKIKKTDSK